MGEASEPVIRIFGILDVTGEVIAMWVFLALAVVISLLVTRHLKERPGKLQNLLEIAVEALDDFCAGILGRENGRKYLFFLGPLFCFILLSNYSGLIPGVGLSKYIKAPTSSLSVTMGLGIITFIFLQAAGIHAGAKHYLKHFLTPLVPLLLLDEFIKPASLALRLFGNIFGEETVTENLYHLLPVGVPIIMMVLSLLFCAVQGIVYTMLTASYLQEIIE